KSEHTSDPRTEQRKSPELMGKNTDRGAEKMVPGIPHRLVRKEFPTLRIPIDRCTFIVYPGHQCGAHRDVGEHDRRNDKERPAFAFSDHGHVVMRRSSSFAHRTLFDPLLVMFT